MADRPPLASISSQMENIGNRQNKCENDSLLKQSNSHVMKKKLELIADEQSEEEPALIQQSLSKLVLANLERINGEAKRDEPLFIEPPMSSPLRLHDAKKKKATPKKRKLGQPIEPIFRKQKSQKRDLEKKNHPNTRSQKKIKRECCTYVDAPKQIE